MAKGKIIVMRLFGGLGNQLFQYAFLFALSRQGGKARLEASSYEHDDKRVCELHHFRVSLPIEGGPPPWAFRKSRIPACLRSLFAAPKYPHFREEKRHGFDPGLAAPPRCHTYFKGYFQTEQYFLHCREQLCREFRLKTPLTQENARVLEDIRSCCSISLHIRRTDYLSNPYLSPPPLEYYLRSMAEMEGRLRAAGVPQESLRYFVFSDDIEWARQNLSPALPHVHVDINDGGAGYFDLELMRNCRHHIIANSTFSWWAAWLNEHAEKIVIAPRIWFNRNEDDRYHTDDALLPGCSAPLEVRLPSSFTSGEDTLYVSRAIARCRSVALTSEKLYHYGLGGPQSVSSRNRKAETRPASYYAIFEMLTREKLREGVLGSNRTAYMNYIVPLLFPDNEMPAGRLRHWAELWREAGITSEHICGIPREQRAYLEAALAGQWIYLRLLQCFWKFKTARRHMFRLRFSKNGIDTIQILGRTLYSAKKLPRSSL